MKTRKSNKPMEKKCKSQNKSNNKVEKLKLKTNKEVSNEPSYRDNHNIGRRASNSNVVTYSLNSHLFFDVYAKFDQNNISPLSSPNKSPQKSSRSPIKGCNFSVTPISPMNADLSSHESLSNNNIAPIQKSQCQSTVSNSKSIVANKHSTYSDVSQTFHPILDCNTLFTTHSSDIIATTKSFGKVSRSASKKLCKAVKNNAKSLKPISDEIITSNQNPSLEISSRSKQDLINLNGTVIINCMESASVQRNDVCKVRFNSCNKDDQTMSNLNQENILKIMQKSPKDVLMDGIESTKDEFLKNGEEKNKDTRETFSKIEKQKEDNEKNKNSMVLMDDEKKKEDMNGEKRKRFPSKENKKTDRVSNTKDSLLDRNNKEENIKRCYKDEAGKQERRKTRSTKKEKNHFVGKMVQCSPEVMLNEKDAKEKFLISKMVKETKEGYPKQKKSKMEEEMVYDCSKVMMEKNDTGNTGFTSYEKEVENGEIENNLLDAMKGSHECRSKVLSITENRMENGKVIIGKVEEEEKKEVSSKRKKNGEIKITPCKVMIDKKDYVEVTILDTSSNRDPIEGPLEMEREENKINRISFKLILSGKEETPNNDCSKYMTDEKPVLMTEGISKAERKNEEMRENILNLLVMPKKDCCKDHFSRKEEEKPAKVNSHENQKDSNERPLMVFTSPKVITKKISTCFFDITSSASQKDREKSSVSIISRQRKIGFHKDNAKSFKIENMSRKVIKKEDGEVRKTLDEVYEDDDDTLWQWDGDSEEKMIKLELDGMMVSKQCYPAIRHTNDDVVIRVNDSVLIRSGDQEPYLAKINTFFFDEENDKKMMALWWYYRPEQTDQGRLLWHTDADVYASKHLDTNSVDCIEDKAFVLPIELYARFMSLQKRQNSSSRQGLSARMVPLMTDDVSATVEPDEQSTPLTEPGMDLLASNFYYTPTMTSSFPPEMSTSNVFVCRGVYDIVHHRITNNILPLIQCPLRPLTNTITAANNTTTNEDLTLERCTSVDSAMSISSSDSESESSLPDTTFAPCRSSRFTSSSSSLQSANNTLPSIASFTIRAPNKYLASSNRKSVSFMPFNYNDI